MSDDLVLRTQEEEFLKLSEELESLAQEEKRKKQKQDLREKYEEQARKHQYLLTKLAKRYLYLRDEHLENISRDKVVALEGLLAKHVRRKIRLFLGIHGAIFGVFAAAAIFLHPVFSVLCFMDIVALLIARLNDDFHFHENCRFLKTRNAWLYEHKPQLTSNQSSSRNSG